MAISFNSKSCFHIFLYYKVQSWPQHKYGNIILNCDHCGLSRDYFTGCCLECGMELCKLRDNIGQHVLMLDE